MFSLAQTFQAHILKFTVTLKHDCQKKLTIDSKLCNKTKQSILYLHQGANRFRTPCRLASHRSKVMNLPDGSPDDSPASRFHSLRSTWSQEANHWKVAEKRAIGSKQIYNVVRVYKGTEICLCPIFTSAISPSCITYLSKTYLVLFCLSSVRFKDMFFDLASSQRPFGMENMCDSCSPWRFKRENTIQHQQRRQEEQEETEKRE